MLVELLRTCLLIQIIWQTKISTIQVVQERILVMSSTKLRLQVIRMSSTIDFEDNQRSRSVVSKNYKRKSSSKNTYYSAKTSHRSNKRYRLRSPEEIKKSRQATEWHSVNKLRHSETSDGNKSPYSKTWINQNWIPEEKNKQRVRLLLIAYFVVRWSAVFWILVINLFLGFFPEKALHVSRHWKPTLFIQNDVFKQQ